jgi:hypothetical protein
VKHGSKHTGGLRAGPAIFPAPGDPKPPARPTFISFGFHKPAQTGASNERDEMKVAVIKETGWGGRPGGNGRPPF